MAEHHGAAVMSAGNGIAEAIVRVMQDVTSVPKGDQFNGGQTRYSYRGVDRVVTALSASMRKHGLVMVPQIVGQPTYTDVTTSQGKAAVRVGVVVTYAIVHGATAESLLVTVPGEAMDSSDKATAKAMSVAWRTALLQTFFLPTDDPDPDSEYVEMGRPGQQPQFRGAGSPEATKRLQQWDDAQEQALAAWNDQVDAVKDDFAALGKLYLEAQQRKAPPAILARIKELGNQIAPQA